MARIRSIKPELPDDETLGACSREARLTFILLWTRCDDHGRFRAAPALIRSTLFPYDDDLSVAMVAGWLNELEKARRVRLYEVAGQTYGEVVNWEKHQRIDNAGKEMVPPPSADILGEIPRDSASHGIPRNGLAANLGESPLDPDPDPDQDQDHDQPTSGEPPQDGKDSRWECALTRLVDSAWTQASQQKVRNRTKWEHAVRANLDDEHFTDAQQLLDRYPDLTGSQLADVLSGNRGLLRLLHRSEL